MDLSVIPDWLRPVVEDIIKYRIDPKNEYYQVSIEHIKTQIQCLAHQQVAAVDNDSKNMKKGILYDPVLVNFIMGSGGQITTWDKVAESRCAIVLRGITKRKEMAACQAQGRDFYYIDTGYFGNGKKKIYHRITKNDVQYFGAIKDRPNDRLEATGYTPKKFTKGSDILLAPPSQKLLNLYGIDLDSWMQKTIEEIKKHSDRNIVVRLKQSRSTRINDDTIEMALDKDIHCLVTFSSIAATEALLYGKPAITLGPNAAGPLCSHSVSEIENLKIPTLDEVYHWAKNLAYCQFTEDEMRQGIAWKILNE
jgi:hypothetical protein